MKSFRPKDGSGEPPDRDRNAERNFHNERRSNETHASTTDPGARLCRKGQDRESRLCFVGHVLMENCHGLAVDAMLTAADQNSRTDRFLRRSAFNAPPFGPKSAIGPTGGLISLASLDPRISDRNFCSPIPTRLKKCSRYLGIAFPELGKPCM